MGKIKKLRKWINNQNNFVKVIFWFCFVLPTLIGIPLFIIYKGGLWPVAMMAYCWFYFDVFIKELF